MNVLGLVHHIDLVRVAPRFMATPILLYCCCKIHHVEEERTGDQEADEDCMQWLEVERDCSAALMHSTVLALDDHNNNIVDCYWK